MPVQCPPSKSCNRAPLEGITMVFEDLVLSDSDDTNNSMVALFHHVFLWMESKNPNHAHHTCFAWKRCTADVVLTSNQSKTSRRCYRVEGKSRLFFVFKMNFYHQGDKPFILVVLVCVLAD